MVYCVNHACPRAAIKPATARAAYRHVELVRLFDPGSIAVVGASPRDGAIGQLALRNLSHFGGRVHLVNAKYPRIGERPCHASLSALPEVPDCVVVAVGREGVHAVLLECVALGVGGAVVFASGYAETGKPAGVADQARLKALASRTKLRILGPNAVGFINHGLGLAASFTPDLALCATAGPAIGLVSQSGGVGNGLTQALKRGVVFSHTLSPANSCDVDCADCISYLAEAPQCRAIAVVLEGLESAARLLDAARRAWANDKPLVIFKLGRGRQGAQAALSHSGFIAGSPEAFDAALESVGAIIVDRLEALIETAAFFAKAPPAPAGAEGVAVVSASGGTVVHAADEAERHGVPLPPMNPALAHRIAALVPDFAEIKNPLDLTSSPNGPQRLVDCTAAILADPAYAAVIAPHVYSFPAEVCKFEMLDGLAKACGKPIVLNWISEWVEGPGAREGHDHPHIAVFRSTGDAFAAVAAWLRRSRRRLAPPVAYVRSAPDVAARAAALIDGVPARVLTEREAKQVLKLYGIPVVEEMLAVDADGAVMAARALGSSVALKIESPDIPHKTEAGAIRLDCRTEEQVRAAYGAIMANARRAAPGARLNGVLVQRMVPAGAEIMVGAQVDPQFGPLVLVGCGGVLVDLMRDVAVALAPVDQAAARALLGRIKGQALLRGYRGASPVDIEALAEVVCRVSELIADQDVRITEIDLNPLICAGDAIVAVDALIARIDPPSSSTERKGAST